MTHAPRNTVFALAVFVASFGLLVAPPQAQAHVETDSGDDCSAPTLCYDEGRQEVKLVRKIGAVPPGEKVRLVAEVKAFGEATDNITFGVLGTEDGEVLAVERMDGLGSGKIALSTRLPRDAGVTRLYFRIAPVVNAKQARSGFGPSKDAAAEVGIIKSVRGPECSAPTRCYDNGRQEVKITREIGASVPDENVQLVAEVKAFGQATDNITFGVLGTEDGSVLAVSRMNDLGSGRLQITTTLPRVNRSTDLYFQIAPVRTESRARSTFGPSEEIAVQVGTLIVPDRGEEPTARIRGTHQIPKNETIRLSAEGAHDPDGRIVSYRWEVRGNGRSKSGTGKEFSASFFQTGRYKARLRVEDDDGNVDEVFHQFTVTPIDPPPGGNDAPRARIDRTETVEKNKAVRLSAEDSSDPDGSIESYSWTIERNGSRVESGSGEQFAASFSEPGNYSVTLVVKDNDGATATATDGFTVVPVDLSDRF